MRAVPILLTIAFVTQAAAAPRPAQWAVPVELPGVANLHKVTDSIYRSAQPTEEGMRNLKILGIRTVINLRAFHSDTDDIEGTGLLDEELSVKTWHIEDEDVIRVLRTVKDPANGPYLIHCQHGSDRTGVMCAMYRIVIQGWTKAAAIDEMINGGYGFHAIWSNIVRYVREVDAARIKSAVEAAPPPPARRPTPSESAP